MGSHAVKGEVAPHNGHVPLGGHLVQRPRVPGQGTIQPVKAPRSGHELFGTGAFLCRAAKEHHTAIQPLPQHTIPDCQSRGKASCPQQVVSTAVACSTGRQRLRLRPGCPLAQPIQGIILCQQSHCRFPRPIAEHRRKASRHSGHMGLHRKPRLFQRPGKGTGRLDLTVGELRIGPDVPGQGLRRRRVTAYGLPDHLHVNHKLPPIKPC